MYQGKLRKITILLIALYTILILYFLYIGFNRISFMDNPRLRYSLIPEGVPLHFPTGRDFKKWFFELGNFVAFIPFGIVIPLLFRSSFIRFIILFILSITVLETLQMLSHLGAFDIDDIIINTLGAAVGFCAQRLVPRNRDKIKGICRILVTACILSIGFVAMVGEMNHYLEKSSGEYTLLNELLSEDGPMQWNESLSSFSAARDKVDPQINIYSRKNTKTNKFTYLLKRKYAEISKLCRYTR